MRTRHLTPRLWLAGLGLLLLSACGASSPAVSYPPAGQVNVQAQPAVPPGVQAQYTGQAQPTLSLINEYPVTQYLFMDQQLLGMVPCGQQGNFAVTEGPHVFLSADSANPNDNPARLDIHVAPGTAYAYRIYVQQAGPGHPQCAQAQQAQQAPQALPEGVEARHTGQAQPTIQLVNEYPVTQHLFLDRQPLGTIPCGESREFPIPEGAHIFHSADSANPDDNPARFQIAVAAGTAYRYTVYSQRAGIGHPQCPRR